ncbi:MAG: sulfurtransferase [Rhodothermales bacterium]
MTYRTLISIPDLAANLNDENVVVVDCRFSLDDPDYGSRAYEKAHVPGAVYAHLDHDLSAPIVPGETGRHPLPSPDRAAATFAGWGIGDGIQVVAYDDAGGAIAGRLWWTLRYLGHYPAAVLDGGWTGWMEDGRPTASGTENRSPRSFEPRVHTGWTVDAPTVDDRRTNPSWVLLDARDGVRYRGEEEPIDPIPGHIPGALSAPFKANLDATGRFKSPEALRERFVGLIGTTPPGHVISQCGSGVTACHNILAMEHAGLSGGLLYPGSWSEWITDPNRPVATVEDMP